MTTNVYVLRLSDHCWYVGKAGDVTKRIQQHNSVTGGSAWTQLHKPLGLHIIYPNVSPFDEDKYTKEYMMKYGIDNVRGGSYVTVKLDAQQIVLLRREIWGAQDLCFVCGGDHFVRNCAVKKALPVTGAVKETAQDTVSTSAHSEAEESESEAMRLYRIENNKKCEDAVKRFCAYIGRCLDRVFAST